MCRCHGLETLTEVHPVDVEMGNEVAVVVQYPYSNAEVRFHCAHAWIVLERRVVKVHHAVASNDEDVGDRTPVRTVFSLLEVDLEVPKPSDQIVRY